MRVLVCGDRDWDDAYVIHNILTGIAFEVDEPLTIIQGMAKGADSIANQWAETWYKTQIREGQPRPGMADVTNDPYPADWETHHRAAGPIRNQKMLVEGKPDVVYAFHSDIGHSRGTRDMVNRAVKAGVPTYVISKVTQKVEDLGPLPDKKKIKEGLEQIALDVKGL